MRGDRRAWWRIVLLVPALVLLALPAMAGTLQPAGEATLTDLIATERSRAGVGGLRLHSDLITAARRQAEAMAAQGELFHTPDLGSVTTGWSRLGENVAVASSVEGAHQALMASASHRANILDSRFTHLGVGVVTADSRVWVVEIFMTSSDGDFSPPFADDDGSVHEQDIALLAASGITSGCGPVRFCPDELVSREQLASFLSRAMSLGPISVDFFVDDDGSSHENDINTVAGAGVTQGCAPSAYCPQAPVPRADMAVLLARALGLPPSANDHFVDDDGWPQEGAINALADAGITKGCGEARYCPDGSVSRAQMASYLVRAFGL